MNCHTLCLWLPNRVVESVSSHLEFLTKKWYYSVTRSFYHQLVSSGVHIFEWTPGFCHAKMSIADDRMATCGTINLDYRSLFLHFECGVFMYKTKA